MGAPERGRPRRPNHPDLDSSRRRSDVRVDPDTNSPVNDEARAGKVEGETLSFYVWTGTEQPVKTIYAGIISASGDQVSFAVTGGRGGT